MINQIPPSAFGPDITWVRENKVVEITGMSLPWLRKKRQTGGGIPYTKLGRNVRYKLADIIAYMKEREVSSTSEHQLLLSGSVD